MILMAMVVAMVPLPLRIALLYQRPCQAASYGAIPSSSPGLCVRVWMGETKLL